MVGRYPAPKWRFPLLVLAVGAVAAVLIAFSWHPMVKWSALAAIALAALGIQFFPAYLKDAEKAGKEHDQEFRRRRYLRWQKTLQARRETTSPETCGPPAGGDRPSNGH